MKITWLGQAGLLFEHNNKTVMIDPYLSDSVRRINADNYRRVAVKEELFDIKPDIMIFTHNHLDHFDPETAERFITPETGVTVLAPESVWGEVRKIGGRNNFVQFNAGTVWSEGGFVFAAVHAQHSDPHAIGVILDDGTRKYYITGDTLYHKKIFEDLPQDIYAVFLPVNGVGNNMNMTDAVKFCKKINPVYAIPMHCGMFDAIDMNLFEYEKKVVPELYKEIVLK